MYSSGNKLTPPQIMIFRQISSLLLKREFSLIFPRYRGKFHEESKYFIRIFATRLYCSYLLLVFMRKSAKPPCVHANPNYHQCTPVPPECAEIVDLIMFSPGKNPIPKNFLKKELRLFENRHKIALFTIFVIFE